MKMKRMQQILKVISLRTKKMTIFKGSMVRNPIRIAMTIQKKVMKKITSVGSMRVIKNQGKFLAIGTLNSAC